MSDRDAIELIKRQSGVDDTELIQQMFDACKHNVVSTISRLLGFDNETDTNTATATTDGDDAPGASTQSDLRTLREIIREKDAIFFDYMSKQRGSVSLDGGAEAQLEGAQAGDRIDAD
jgi:hypothetical protein